MLLVVVEEIILLLCEVCGLKCHLEAVCRLWRSLDILIVASMNLFDKVESVLRPCLFPASPSEDSYQAQGSTYSLETGWSFAAFFLYSSPKM